MSDADDSKEYLVRGAMLCCSMGTHPRRLNLPRSNGVYLREKPMIAKSDCKKDDNISYFGICSSSTPPEGAEEILLAGFVPEGVDEVVPDVQGKMCTPDIMGEWSDVNGVAVTMDSFLVCKCGGIIEPVTSGQEYED